MNKFTNLVNNFIQLLNHLLKVVVLDDTVYIKKFKYLNIVGVEGIVNIEAFIFGICLALTGLLTSAADVFVSDLFVKRIDLLGALADLRLVFTCDLK